MILYHLKMNYSKYFKKINKSLVHLLVEKVAMGGNLPFLIHHLVYLYGIFAGFRRYHTFIIVGCIVLPRIALCLFGVIHVSILRILEI